jgi:hypothetical protein
MSSGNCSPGQTKYPNNTAPLWRRFFLFIYIICNQNVLYFQSLNHKLNVMRILKSRLTFVNSYKYLITIKNILNSKIFIILQLLDYMTDISNKIVKSVWINYKYMYI